MECLAQIDKAKSNYGFKPEHPRQSGSTNLFLISKSASASMSSKDLFRKYADKWQKETSHVSLISQRLQHKAYISIISMGPSAIPLILKDMERQPDHWFYALTFLTGANPIPANFTGTITEATDLWIQWGKDRYAT